jgi:hypothetical protein
MQITLPNDVAATLAQMPENGMGYQVVDITFDDGTIAQEAVVFNASLAEVPDVCVGKAVRSVALRRR